MFSTDLPDIIADLPMELESDHFVIRFGYRNPVAGRGLGPDGVRDRVLILTYLQALERLYNKLRTPPWDWPEPLTHQDGKTRVYVCDTDPLTSYDDDRIPCILLSSRSDEPSSHSELLRASADAVHEATHLFNFRTRPYYETSSSPWIWFDEGLAVLMETLVASGNTDYFRFLRDWIDIPEMPLDEAEEKYHSGMFLSYLCQKIGPQFIRDVWLNSNIGDGPLKALQDIAAKHNLTFASADPNVHDIFGSGYCMDPYFLWDHASISLAPDILFRFGERAIAETFNLSPGSSAKDTGFLDHLSCRYYRFNLDPRVTEIELAVLVRELCRDTPIKAELAVVSTSKQRSTTVPLARDEGDDSCRLGTRLRVPRNCVDHLVLVVSNCGVRSSLTHRQGEHEDEKEYSVIASAK